MKKIRKIGAALGTALLAGATVTTAAANLDDYPQPFIDEDGNIATNIVVGDDAKTADVVGAIDIAGSLGNSAYETESVSSTGAVDGETIEQNIRGTFPTTTLDASDYSRLERTTVEDDDGNDVFVTESATVDTLESSANETDTEVDIGQGDVSYTVQYSPGFTVNDTVQMLGNEYELVSVSDTEVDLGSTMEQTGLVVGDSYSHGPYSVEVVDRDEENSEIFVRISRDEEVLKSRGLGSGGEIEVDDGDFSVTADSVFFGSNQDYIDVTSTHVNTVLEEGEDLPMDDNYQVNNIETGTSASGDTTLQSVKASNTLVTADEPEEEETEPLTEGTSFPGPSDYFTVTYQGLTSEATEEIEFNDGYEVTYSDAGNFEHSLDMRNLKASTAASLTDTNPWSGAADPVAFHESGTTTGWQNGEDLIVQDYNNGGTVSTGADTALNTGDDSSVGTSAGATYEDISSIGGSYYLVSSDSTFDAGEDVVTDDDNDGVYTGQADTVVAGQTLSGGTSITDENAQDADWTISSIDDSDTDAWDSNVDTLYEDADGDNAYTLQADNVLAGTDTNFAQGDSLTDGGSLDGEWTGASTGDIMYYDASSGGGWDSSADAIWVDNSGGTSDGKYVSADDDLLAGSEPGDNTDKSGDGVDSTDWSTINVYDHNSGGDWDSNNDAIVEDFHDGKTYSTGQDSVVAGNTPSDGATGATHTSNGFDGDWSLDSIDVSGSGDWDSSADAIVIDVGDRGTFSAGPDTVVNDGGTSDRTDGDDLVQLNSVSSPSNIVWNDIGDDGYDSGDEIFVDDDNDGQYTAQADNQLAGVSLSTVGAGTSISTSNQWSSVSSPVKFVDDGDGVWQSSDTIAVDEDDDGSYTSSDTLVAGSAPSTSPVIDETESSKTVYTDINGRPVEIEWDSSSGEATISYQEYDTTLAPGETVDADTGYGFTLDADFNDADSDSNGDLLVSGADSELDTYEGANINYNSGNSMIQFDEMGDGYDAGNSDGQDFGVKYDGDDEVKEVQTDGLGTLTDSDALTNHGSSIETSDVAPVTVNYPEKALKAEVAVGSVGESMENTVNTPTGFPDSAALDSEMDEPSTNTILVGGPMVNDLTEELASRDLTWNASEYESSQDVGLIDYVDEAFGENSAVVVAGHQAGDTRAASLFLSDYLDHQEDLTGSQVTVDTESGEVV